MRAVSGLDFMTAETPQGRLSRVVVRGNVNAGRPDILPGLVAGETVVADHERGARPVGPRSCGPASAIGAVAEVGNPTNVATRTIVAALLPMPFVSGRWVPSCHVGAFGPNRPARG
jgi:hypothetical protein